MANSFSKLCLTACCVTRTGRLNNKTECRIFPYKRVSLKKILLPWFNKSKCSLNISSWNALRAAHSRKLSAKVYANCVQMLIDASLAWLLFWRSNFIMIRFGSPERDYSLSNGGMTLEKGLRSQHSKDVQLHDSLGWPTKATSSKRTSQNFCWHVKGPRKFSANKFSINT